MELRKAQSEKKKFDRFSSEFFMESTEVSHPIDEEPGGNLEERLKKCIEKLKKEQKKCIQMFYYENRCYQEISESLDIDKNKVKSYIQNGRRNLKICLEQNTNKDEKQKKIDI